MTHFLCKDKVFSRPLVMGILNMTPDSFSGDGLLSQDNYATKAIEQAERMVTEGADILDIGGESSRPGSTPVTAEEEIRRTVPAISAIRAKMPDVPISIDTVKPEVAKAALQAGADIINDISGESADPAMLELAARHGAYIVLMHNRSGAVKLDALIGGEYQAPAYADIVADVRRDLENMAKRALAAGVKKDRIILDPGLGFGKTVEQNLRLINRMDDIAALGYPVLAGPSRKSFIGRILGAPPEDRQHGTIAAVAACIMRGASVVRVHDVRETACAVKIAAAIRSA